MDGEQHIQEDMHAGMQGQPQAQEQPQPGAFGGMGQGAMDFLQAMAHIMQGQVQNQRPQDIKANEPKPFNGDSNRARDFMQDCELQFAINPHKFTRDEAKIGYVLS